MREANNQLMIAFVILTVTTVFGFGAKVISDLGLIRDLGIASAIGIIFTFLIFGLLLPAAKLEVDKLRDAYGVPEFNSAPIPSSDSTLGRLLTAPAQVSRYAPIAFAVLNSDLIYRYHRFRRVKPRKSNLPWKSISSTSSSSVVT